MGINLPKEVSFSKEQRPYGWVYIFQHNQLGRLGRIVLQGRADGRTQITCEIAGDENDPMTQQRAAIFKPLSKRIADEMQRMTGGVVADDHMNAPPPFIPKEAPKKIARKLMQCEGCDAGIGLIILAPEADNECALENYARLMYPEIMQFKVPSWIVGAMIPLAGIDQSNEPRCIIKKVYPQREAIFYASPDEFNAITDQLRAEHCFSKKYCT
ncbi:MAG: hypothetical protein AAF806_11645 [Bacteroidota bacterium]